MHNYYWCIDMYVWTAGGDDGGDDGDGDDHHAHDDIVDFVVMLLMIVIIFVMIMILLMMVMLSILIVLLMLVVRASCKKLKLRVRRLFPSIHWGGWRKVNYTCPSVRPNDSPVSAWSLLDEEYCCEAHRHSSEVA